MWVGSDRIGLHFLFFSDIRSSNLGQDRTGTETEYRIAHLFYESAGDCFSNGTILLDRIALHFNPRFNAKGNINTIVCNSFEAGRWCEEKHCVCIYTKFVVTLPCDSTIHFPNRFGAEKYSVMTFKGDALIRSIEIK
uniref:Galectin n=1 Tax=Amphilophus citrinellus TaxID=61819 RepID=A0A3Q0R2U5_AMPCI